MCYIHILYNVRSDSVIGEVDTENGHNSFLDF